MVVYGLPYIYGMDMLHSQNVKLQKPLSFRVTIDFQVLGVVKTPCRTANMHTFGGLIRSLNAWPWCLDSRFVLNSIVGSKSTSRKGYRLQRTHHIELELDCPVKKGSSSTAKRLPFLLPWKFPFDHCLDLVFV